MFECDGGVSAVQQITAGTDALLIDGAFDRLGRDDFLDLIRALETQRRRLAAVDEVVIAELTERGCAGELCERSTSTLLRNMLRLSASEAAARVRAARQCGPRHGLDGQPLPPARPVVAAAQGAGTVSSEQAALIARVLSGLPTAIPDDVVDDVEATLVEHAGVFGPAELSVVASRIVATLDPDGELVDDAEHERRRTWSLRQHADGFFDLRGRLTPECGAAWQAVLTPLAAPSTEKPSTDPTCTGRDADLRTATQRRHDGFYEAAMRLLGGGLPASGGVPTTLIVSLSVDQLETRTGVATTAHGGILTVPQALRAAAEANLIPVVFDDVGGVLAFGRRRRVASIGQTYAIYARDLRCTVPGCDQPGAWCERDHAPAWCDGGQTDIDGMHLTCRHHNQPKHRNGWKPAIINGVPHWIPPPWIDPDQTPRRNPQPERIPLRRGEQAAAVCRAQRPCRDGRLCRCCTCGL